jgi:transposase InsO family protein
VKHFPTIQNAKYLIYDRDAKFGSQVSELVASLNLKTVRTSFRSPWQNGVAERWVGSCRRDLLDHVMPLGESHLKRLLAD